MEHLQPTGKLKETLEMCLIVLYDFTCYTQRKTFSCCFLWIKEKQLINQIKTSAKLCLFPQMIQIHKYCSAEEEEKEKQPVYMYYFCLFTF